MFIFSSAKCSKGFSKLNDSVKSSLQKCIIYHPCVIQSPIENYYITVKSDDGIIVVQTEIRHKLLLQLSVRELHIEILEKDATGFSMACNKKGISRISDYAL